MNLVVEYIKDLKVEGVKLQFQLCSPYTQIQKNDVLGNFDFDELHSVVMIDVLKEAITQLERVSTYDELYELFEAWDKERLIIQYEGYHFDSKRKTRAWMHVFLKRILRKKHKDLHRQIFGK